MEIGAAEQAGMDKSLVLKRSLKYGGRKHVKDERKE